MSYEELGQLMDTDFGIDKEDFDVDELLLILTIREERRPPDKEATQAAFQRFLEDYAPEEFLNSMSR